MKSRFPALMFAVLIAVSAPARAESDATTPIRQLCDRLIEVMKQGDQLGFRGRESKLRPVVASSYDMPVVTKNTLGLAANKLTPEETDSLAEAYIRFSVATYADQFRAWGGEKFEIGETRTLPNGGIVVPTVIIGGDGSRTAIDYLVHETKEGWRIVDVLFQGSISQVAVRRSEFVPMFRQNGLAALVAMLDSKTDALEKK